MEINFKKIGNWERSKAIYLLSVADQLGIDLDGYGELNVNPRSGNTYLWFEDYNFCLYMPINCELCRGDVWVAWTDPENGDEEEISLDNMTLQDIEKWVEGLEKEREDQSDDND